MPRHPQSSLARPAGNRRIVPSVKPPYSPPLAREAFHRRRRRPNFAAITQSMATHQKTSGGSQDHQPTHGHHGNALGKAFSRFSHAIAHASGTPSAFLIATVTIL